MRKNAPVPRIWDESAFRFVVPPKFKAVRPPFCLLCTGRGPWASPPPLVPLSFTLCAGRAALQRWRPSLCGRRGTGVLMLRRHTRFERSLL